MMAHVKDMGNGKWKVTISDGFKPNGDRRRIYDTITATTQRKAQREADRLEAEIKQNRSLAPANMTVHDFGSKWLDEYAAVNLGTKTVHEYRQLFKRLSNDIGHIKLVELNALHLQQWYNAMQKATTKTGGKKLSANTISHYHALVSSILATAVKWGFLDDNVAKKVRPPKKQTKPGRHYSHQELNALLASLSTELLLWRVLMHLALTTGLRRSELMGLKWPDIDFANQTITVRRARQYVPGKGVFNKEPKTPSSARTMAVPESSLELLKALKCEQDDLQAYLGANWQGDDYVFLSPEGKPLHPDSSTQWLRKHCTKHNLKYVGMHGLRHTSATMLIGGGVNMKNVSSRLGHTSAVTTMGIYVHAQEEIDRKAADTLGNIVRADKEGSDRP